MLKKLASAAGIVLLASSFALADQPPAPAAPQTTTPQTTTPAPQGRAKTHHRGRKHRGHHKHHKPAPKQQ